MARLFANEAKQRDGEIIAIESYKEGDSDVGAQLKRMKAEDLKKYGLAVPVDPTKIEAGSPSSTRKCSIRPFDAVFIPGRASDVGLIAAQLNFHDMKVPFLGSNGWNARTSHGGSIHRRRGLRRRILCRQSKSQRSGVRRALKSGFKIRRRCLPCRDMTRQKS